MDKQPPLVLSSRDIKRLERLLDSEAYKNLPGIDALQNEIDRASVVAPADVPPGVVTMNSTVRFCDDSTDSCYELTLVYPDAVRSPETVSVLAPVGSALLGLSVGQSIAWQVPGSRTLSLRILEVTYQPEATGELHR
ncbi:MAG: nucleoside diphosphate kinase regulator [Gammaproteobacteria bacterium]